MPREPKILTPRELNKVLQHWEYPLETLSKHQLIQVLAATREILKKSGEELAEYRHQHCDHEDCRQKPLIRRCEEHAGEPPPATCSECGAPATEILCAEHGKPPKCGRCDEEADTHTCEKHSKIECDDCKKEATVSFCDEHNPEAALRDVVEALAEPANTPEERVWRKHHIERLVEGAGFTSPTVNI